MGEIGPKTPQKIGKMNEMKLKISEISEIPKNRYVSSFFPLIRDMLPQVMVAVLEKIGKGEQRNNYCKRNNCCKRMLRH